MKSCKGRINQLASLLTDNEELREELRGELLSNLEQTEVSTEKVSFMAMSVLHDLVEVEDALRNFPLATVGQLLAQLSPLVFETQSILKEISPMVSMIDLPLIADRVHMDCERIISAKNKLMNDFIESCELTEKLWVQA